MCEDLALGFRGHQFYLDNKLLWHFLGREVMCIDDMLNKAKLVGHRDSSPHHGYLILALSVWHH